MIISLGGTEANRELKVGGLRNTNTDGYHGTQDTIGFSLADPLVHQYPNSAAVGDADGGPRQQRRLEFRVESKSIIKMGKLLLSSFEIYT